MPFSIQCINHSCTIGKLSLQAGNGLAHGRARYDSIVYVRPDERVRTPATLRV
ncbi:MAG: hypothetical protein JSW71_07470 [Gemmatimonadota bacterium]|nr:MAG: hypothetical protein JSW71_07470 [Gemmatimonadota bacterium]